MFCSNHDYLVYYILHHFGDSPSFHYSIAENLELHTLSLENLTYITAFRQYLHILTISVLMDNDFSSERNGSQVIGKESSC